MKGWKGPFFPEFLYSYFKFFSHMHISLFFELSLLRFEYSAAIKLQSTGVLVENQSQ